MESNLEKKWNLLDENEQRMIVSYMNNLISSDEKSIINLDDYPAVRNEKASTALIVPAYPGEKEKEQRPKAKPVAEPKKEANPGPLGLLGFGMTTILLNIHNAGIIEMSAMILAMGIAMGGLAQIIAGLQEFKAGNTFGATAFTSYGLFWWSLVIILTNPESLGGLGASHQSLGYYMVMWCIFTGFMYLGTLKGDVSMKIIFGSLTILFALLAIENFMENPNVAIIAGFEGIFCGASAVYTSLATILNTQYGKTVMPV